MQRIFRTNVLCLILFILSGSALGFSQAAGIIVRRTPEGDYNLLATPVEGMRNYDIIFHPAGASALLFSSTDPRMAQLYWLDRGAGLEGPFRDISWDLSPDGRQLAFVVQDGSEQYFGKYWVLHGQRRDGPYTAANRLLFSPDSSLIYYWYFDGHDNRLVIGEHHYQAEETAHLRLLHFFAGHHYVMVQGSNRASGAATAEYYLTVDQKRSGPWAALPGSLFAAPDGQDFAIVLSQADGSQWVSQAAGDYGPYDIVGPITFDEDGHSAVYIARELGLNGPAWSLFVAGQRVLGPLAEPPGHLVMSSGGKYEHDRYNGFLPMVSKNRQHWVMAISENQRFYLLVDGQRWGPFSRTGAESWLSQFEFSHDGSNFVAEVGSANGERWLYGPNYRIPIRPNSLFSHTEGILLQQYHSRHWRLADDGQTLYLVYSINYDTLNEVELWGAGSVLISRTPNAKMPAEMIASYFPPGYRREIVGQESFLVCPAGRFGPMESMLWSRRTTGQGLAWLQRQPGHLLLFWNGRQIADFPEAKIDDISGTSGLNQVRTMMSTNSGSVLGYWLATHPPSNEVRWAVYGIWVRSFQKTDTVTGGWIYYDMESRP